MRGCHVNKITTKRVPKFRQYTQNLGPVCEQINEILTLIWFTFRDHFGKTYRKG